MSEKHKQLFARMNQDTDCRGLKPGEYRLLRNGINVQGTTANALEAAIASVYGHALVTNAALEANSVVVGFLEDRANNRAFFAVYNSNTNHTIYQVSSAFVVSTVLRTALFGFTSTGFVDMEIVGDVLLLTDNNSDIKKINITKAIAGATYTPLTEEITLIKRPPKRPVTILPLYDINYSNNYVSGNYFQFFHRFIYEDGDMSVFGGCSKSTDSWVLPSTSVDVMGVIGTNYAISGTQTIDGYFADVGARVLLKNQTSAIQNGIWVVASGSWTRATDADSSAELLALNVYVKSGDEGAGTVWRNTNTSSITIGVTDIGFRQIDGPNAIDVTTDTADIPATVTYIEYGVRINGSSEVIIYKLDENPLGGATHRFYNDTFLYTVSDSESFKWSDSIPIKSRAIRFIKDRIFLLNNTEGYTHSTTTTVSLSVSTVAFTDTLAFRHFKDGGTYNIGIVFFDFAGRFVGGVHCDDQITVPYRTLPIPIGSSEPPYKIVVDLTGIAQADIPLSATDYAVVVSNLTDKSFFIRSMTRDFFYYTEDSDEIKSFTKTYSGQVVGSAIDIKSLISAGIGYTFNSGDRIIIHNQAPVGYSGGIFVDVPVISQDGGFIFVKPLPEFQSILFGSGTRLFFEVYSPKTVTQESFYEVGDKYAISNPGGGSRAFSTTSISPTGDVSSVLRKVYESSGAYSSTDPFSNTYVILTSYPFEAMNSWDRKFNVWVKPGAKSTDKSAFATTQNVKYNAIRFGQPYIQSSAILKINTFEALDEQILPIESGVGVSLAIAENVLMAIHEVESNAVYVGEGFVNTASGNNFLTKTESVIGDDRKYAGGHGTTHPASVVSRDSRVYFYDSRKGCIVRRSQDGLTRISDYGMKGFVSYLATLHNVDPNNSRIVAGWDPQYDCYCISFYLTGGSYNYTLYFHERTNSWVCVTDLMPIRFGILGQYQLAFNTGGGMWKQTPEANYNTFFGTAYSRRLEWEIAPFESLMKILEAIEVDSESIYTTDGSNEELVSVYLEEGGTKQTQINYTDFRQREGVWRSPFFNDINDVNFGSALESKFKSPYKVRGQNFYFVLVYNGTDKNRMRSITTFFRPKMNSSQ